MNEIARYGVREALSARTDLEVKAEELRLLGYTTLDAGLSSADLNALSDGFDRGRKDYEEIAAGKGVNLAAIQESDTIRVLPMVSPQFWAVVFNERLHELLSQLLGDYYILNQVNGLINRGNGSKYGQSAYHRDLPYQHFVSSRPIAINALFAVDDFTIENGATRVIPASQHMEAFPSDGTVKNLQHQVAVPRGTFIVLDCMLYHSGALNTTSADRRAVNHVFTIPMLRQQLHLPSIIGDKMELSEWQKKILGFGLDEFRSLEDWFAARASKN
ncbi:phytanoyl-CoA dioxygenase family protein [Phyllobacterium chamaecytisi]|uniref:phytanoyl-CoA dioxygenase family protein n=1 Tax=Phyllobacterium chamaecytisi TaxID=2876082 RepID=UPI001CCAEA4A|nr:phytanoyl-CoA dioxygenase family protein [Phyllobacterium sp. KW56]MBZ9601977.1 phytanoyl-CoA dioxygenase family protein [Phyllobacterium sp. KW56]